MTLPIIESCDGCGVCCYEQTLLPISWYIAGLGDLSALPSELQAEIRAAGDNAVANGYPPDGSRCIWLTDDDKCRHYEHRPDVCRELERGGDGCRNWREEYGVE